VGLATTSASHFAWKRGTKREGLRKKHQYTNEIPDISRRVLQENGGPRGVHCEVLREVQERKGGPYELLDPFIKGRGVKKGGELVVTTYTKKVRLDDGREGGVPLNFYYEGRICS